MSTKTDAFLGKHNFSLHQDINAAINGLLDDMTNGLNGKGSDEDMIKTYSLPPKESPKNKSVIVIDAGGTNFRTALVSFDEKGNVSISDLQKTKMPGVERELSKKEFFDEIAKNLEHLKDKSSDIGFCFSYPMTITPDRDGILIGFAKEVKAPEVEGCRIGKELSKALKENGWKTEPKITLMNDTVSALLAGASGIPEGKKYSSYIGYILGTGMNAAYMEDQIIVCESGKFCSLPSSDFDIELDKNSAKPGTSFLEKQCAGAYLGNLSGIMLKAAAKEGLFSNAFASKVLELNSSNFTTVDMNIFLHNTGSTESSLGRIVLECATEDDIETAFTLLDAVCERSARLSAAIISACVIKSGKGKLYSEPVCVLCDGTTFHRTYRIEERVLGYLEQTLLMQRNLHYELVAKDDDITIGTAVGGLM